MIHVKPLLCWFFYNGKSARNEPKFTRFSKFVQNSPENDIHVKQESIPPFLGIIGDKKWCPFLDLGIQSPIFCCTGKRPFSVILGAKNSSSKKDSR